MKKTKSKEKTNQEKNQNTIRANDLKKIMKKRSIEKIRDSFFELCEEKKIKNYYFESNRDVIIFNADGKTFEFNIEKRKIKDY